MQTAALIDLRAPDVLAAAERRFERDRTDDLIQALVMARMTGMTRDEASALVNDTWSAPWSSDSRREC